jgi:hypothetical protein
VGQACIACRSPAPYDRHYTPVPAKPDCIRPQSFRHLPPHRTCRGAFRVAFRVTPRLCLPLCSLDVQPTTPILFIAHRHNSSELCVVQACIACPSPAPSDRQYMPHHQTPATSALEASSPPPRSPRFSSTGNPCLCSTDFSRSSFDFPPTHSKPRRPPPHSTALPPPPPTGSALTVPVLIFTFTLCLSSGNISPARNPLHPGCAHATRHSPHRRRTPHVRPRAPVRSPHLRLPAHNLESSHP